MSRDPLKWLTDYKVGNPWRKPANTINTDNFQINEFDDNVGGIGTKIWLMGDGTGDSYDTIKNQVSINASDSFLIMKNMNSTDIQEVTDFEF